MPKASPGARISCVESATSSRGVPAGFQHSLLCNLCYLIGCRSRTDDKPENMSRFREYAAVLVPHPETSRRTAHTIRVQLRWTDAGALALDYALCGDLACLRIPPPRAPQRADNLWQHTCFEAFVSPAGTPEYWEFNVSPSGEWAIYRFHGYRERASFDGADRAPQIAAHRVDDRLDLHVTVSLRDLPITSQSAHLRLGLSAVIEDENGAMSYWALKHPAAQPDFHHADSFSLQVTRPETGMVQS